MATKPTKLLFPVEGEFVPQDKYVAATTKAFKKANKGVKLEEKQTKQILGFVLKGETLEEETEQVYKDLYKLIENDFEAAKEKDAAEEAAKNAVGKRSLTILTTALEGSIPAEVLDSKFILSPTGVSIGEGVSDEEIASKLLRMLDASSFSAWAIGDLGNELKRRGQEGVIDNLCAKTGRAGSTVYSHMQIAATIPPEQRSTKVLPSTYAEIIKPVLNDNPKKDADIKRKLIAEAEKKEWTSKEARSAANEARTTPKGKQGKASTPVASFLVIDSEGKPRLVVDEPGFDEENLVINVKNKTYLGERPKAEGSEETIIDWIEIPLAEK